MSDRELIIEAISYCARHPEFLDKWLSEGYVDEVKAVVDDIEMTKLNSFGSME